MRLDNEKKQNQTKLHENYTVTDNKPWRHFCSHFSRCTYLPLAVLCAQSSVDRKPSHSEEKRIETVININKYRKRMIG